MSRKLLHGDCLELLPTLEAGSVDAICTDPPAGISFMGAKWDSFGGRCNGNAERDRAAGNRGPGAGLGNQPFGYSGSALPKRGEREAFVSFLSAAMSAALRCLNPGGYALVWALPRTSHWTATALEDAGFELNNRIAHVFGTGFPKGKGQPKPAVEDWWLCRKPGAKVLPLNVDGCRVEGVVPKTTQGASSRIYGGGNGLCPNGLQESDPHPAGRWPPNLLLTCACDDSAAHDEGCPVRLLDEQSGQRPGDSPNRKPRVHTAPPGGDGRTLNCGWSGGETPGHADSGGASRFFPVFYCPKECSANRWFYCQDCKDAFQANTRRQHLHGHRDENNKKDYSHLVFHPTQKDIELMRWLVKLISFPGQTVLDCFMGSGSTGVACAKEDRKFIGVEQSLEYYTIARRRAASASRKVTEFD